MPEFGFENYHVFLAVLGASLVAAYWLPHAFLKYPPGASALIMLLGMLSYQFVPGMPMPFDPLQSPVVWEKVSEIVVIIVLFATGLSIDDVKQQSWKQTIRLLVVAMPITVFAIAILGWGLAGMTIAGATILGAVLSPTDPVLAGDVQVGPPKEGREHPVRFTLTTEAGLNDGLAFPFVYLGLAIAVPDVTAGQWITEFILFDLIYRILVGAVAGCLLGWLLGKISFAKSGAKFLADSGTGIVALAGTFICYGLVELVEGYGFLAVFLAGLCYRQTNVGHHIHKKMHVFSRSVEEALTVILLFVLGSTLPVLWPYLDWRHSVIGFGLIFIIRPVAGMISLIGSSSPPMHRLAISFLGVRGIGSIFYMAYAARHIEFLDKEQLWALVAFTIFASAVIHGALAKPIVDYATGGK